MLGSALLSAARIASRGGGSESKTLLTFKSGARTFGVGRMHRGAAFKGASRRGFFSVSARTRRARPTWCMTFGSSGLASSVLKTSSRGLHGGARRNVIGVGTNGGWRSTAIAMITASSLSVAGLSAMGTFQQIDSVSKCQEGINDRSSAAVSGSTPPPLAPDVIADSATSLKEDAQEENERNGEETGNCLPATASCENENTEDAKANEAGVGVEKGEEDTTSPDITVDAISKANLSTRSIWSWVLQAAAHDWWLYLGAGIASVGMAFCGVQTAGSFGNIFENIKSPDAIKAAYASGAFWDPVRRLLLLFSAQFSLNFVASNFLSRATNQLGKRLRLSYYASVLRQEIAFFDKHKSGELMQHLGEDIGAICTATRQMFTTGLRSLFDIVLGGYMMWQVSSDMTFALFMIMPIMAGSGHAMGSLLRSQSKRVSEAAGIASAVANEDVANIRTVKAFVNEDKELKRYDDALSKAAHEKTKMALATGTFFGALHFGINLTQLAISFYGGHLISQGKMSSGGMVSIVSQTMRLQHAFAGLSRTYSNLVKAVSTCEGVYSVVKRSPPEWSEASLDGRRYMLYGSGEGFCPSHLEGDIVFDGVTFAYPTRPTHHVLNNFRLEIESGTVCALVGASGSGKSTLGALLEKFYSPDLSHGGGIILDGRRLGTIDTKWLRANVGIVDQSPALFACSVLENIRYGKPTATLEEVIEAAKAANAHSFISDFPDGYGTDLGERGTALSGGQRQRIAIARAILKDPRILILDEATSALDSESEHIVQEALDRLMQGRTTLIIAHRLSTIVGADKICVVDQGRLVEMGSHSELIEAGGKYAALFRRQQEAV